MKKILLVLFFIFFVFSSARAQEWARVYGGIEEDQSSMIQLTQDGGYVVVGYTKSFGSGGSDIWVLKLDDNGTIEWQKTYGGPKDDEAYSIQQTSEGGYILAGRTLSFGQGFNDIWVLKLAADGSIEWQKTYGGGDGDEIANYIEETSDGGYILTGTTASSNAGGSDILVLKLDANGTIEWQKTYGEANNDKGQVVHQTTDGGYILAGETWPLGKIYSDMLVLKLAADGSIEWQKTYGNSNYEEAYAIEETSDGGYILTGTTASFGAGESDIWVLKLDTDGSIEWQKTYGGAKDDAAYAIHQTSDGGYILAGESSSFGVENLNAFVLKLDAQGNILWQKAYGGSTSTDCAFSIKEIVSSGETSGFIVAGYSDLSGSSDFWLLKTDSKGNIGNCAYVSVSTAISKDTDITGVDATLSSSDTTVISENTSVTAEETSASSFQACPIENNENNDNNGGGGCSLNNRGRSNLIDIILILSPFVFLFIRKTKIFQR